MSCRAPQSASAPQLATRCRRQYSSGKLPETALSLSARSEGLQGVLEVSQWPGPSLYAPGKVLGSLAWAQATVQPGRRPPPSSGRQNSASHASSHGTEQETSGRPRALQGSGVRECPLGNTAVFKTSRILCCKSLFLTLKGTPPQGGENKASYLAHSKFLIVLYRQQIHVSRFSEASPRRHSTQTPGLGARSWSQLSTPSGRPAPSPASPSPAACRGPHRTALLLAGPVLAGSLRSLGFRLENVAHSSYGLRNVDAGRGDGGSWMAHR